MFVGLQDSATAYIFQGKEMGVLVDKWWIEKKL
ncbi:hypothetical protein VS_1938 [Vibrio atlanticus]|uniref:Uncharacterized protein n=1 Tax=Vibrio atlanticus (strain LGP32) TaxID=575788 RepID=B7VGS1_VIBA3|nr:hypothetical protein VS_1938 [Vibrio atlanticus]